MTTVLFLEPRDECRSGHINALRSAGFDVTAVRDPQAALDSVEAQLPHIVVARLDPRTRIDHLSFCRRIKSDPRMKHIPILLTAEHMGDEDVGLATNPGALVITMPPDNGSKLVAAITGVLAGQQRPTQPIDGSTTSLCSSVGRRG
jgi:two-component system cell cycle response regulator